MRNNRLIAMSLLAATLVAGLAGCTDDPNPATRFGNPPYPVTPAPVSIGSASQQLSTGTPLGTARLTSVSPTSAATLAASGSSSYSIGLPAGSLAAIASRLGASAVNVASTGVSPAQLTAQEQAAIGSALASGRTIMTMIQVDITGAGAGTSGFHAAQAASGQTTYTVKLRAGNVAGNAFPCPTGKVDLVQVVGSSANTVDATVTIGPVQTDADGQFQEITGTSANLVQEVQHFILCFECPKTTSATPLPTGSALPTPTIPTGALPSLGGISLPTFTAGQTAASYCGFISPIYAALLSNPLFSQFLAAIGGTQTAQVQAIINSLSTTSGCVSYLNGLGIQ